MAQLHTYYITNSQKEICYSDNFTSEEIQEAITVAFSPDNYNEIIEETSDYSSDEEEFLNTDSFESISQSLEITNYFDFDDIEFQRLLTVDVQVVIEPMQEIVNHGEKEFDIDSVLDNMLEKLE